VLDEVDAYAWTRHRLHRRSGLTGIAATLRGDGHDVVVPDLYGGGTVDTLEHGLALKDVVGDVKQRRETGDPRLTGARRNPCLARDSA
jgi:hypothetical protein